MALELQQLPCALEGARLILCRFAPAVDRRERRALEQEATRQTLHYALGKASSLAHHPHGAPYLPEEPGWAVSLSHSASAVALLLVPQSSPLHIGIDIEEERAELERVLPRFVREGELAQLKAEGFPRATALRLLWTAKEAAYKAVNPPSGSLLSFVLERCDPAEGLLSLRYPALGLELQLHYLQLAGYFISYTEPIPAALLSPQPQL
nr:4'-phosphopantetheinyl transferase superfamily protein [uncultured Porphyromonas sp.]